MRNLVRIASILLSILFSQNALATEVLVWDKKPLNIRLEVNKERMIEFPDNIMLGIPQKLQSRLRVSAAAGVLYITSIAPFPKTRIQVKLASTNELVFVDLFAVESEDDTESEMVKVITREESVTKDEVQQEQLAQSSSVTIKDLIQHASHDFYAPPRLKTLNRPIVETLLKKPLNLELMYMGRSASLFDLKPIKQYRTSRYTLTAILVTNRTGQNQNIIHRDIYPNFIAASSQHLDVGPIGTVDESTVLYLVSERPLYEDSVYAL